MMPLFIRSVLVGLLFVLAVPPVEAQGRASYLVPVPPEDVVRGRFGSEWETLLWVHNGSAISAGVTVLPSLISEAPVTVPAGSTVALARPGFTGRFPGRAMVLSIDERAAEDLTFELNVRDRTKDLESWGTSFPVVPLTAFGNGTQQFLNVPLVEGFRVDMRIFVQPVSALPARFRVRLWNLEHEHAPVLERSVTVPSPPMIPSSFHDSDVAVASVQEIFRTALLVHGLDRGRVEVVPESPAGSRFWAMITVTNNTSQQITLLAPEGTR